MNGAFILPTTTPIVFVIRLKILHTLCVRKNFSLGELVFHIDLACRVRPHNWKLTPFYGNLRTLLVQVGLCLNVLLVRNDEGGEI